MDGTLVDSEKLWDVSMQELYARHGGVLTPEVRDVHRRRFGRRRDAASSTPTSAWTPIPAAMAESADWLHDYTGELFEAGLPWCAGARELLDALLAAGVPMALVTNTRRGLTEKALNSIGRHYFSVTVCGDEVTDGKPAPGPLPAGRRAARAGSGATVWRSRTR